MVNKIEKLTPEQEAQMAPWAQKWIEIGLSTERVDYEAAGEALARCYKFAGLESPKIIPVPSPLVACLAGPVAAQMLAKGPGAAIDEEEMQQVIKDLWWRYLGGSLWATWPAYESFYREVCGLVLPGDLSQRGEAYADLAKSACWVWPHKDFAMVSDRPLWIDRDAEGRLHSDTRQAIEWSDGWGVAAWHGTQVPREWIEQKDSLDPKKLITHENVEQRRAAMEIIGWDKVLTALGAKVVDKNPNPEIGTLLRCDLPDAPGSQFLKVRCGTGRTFALPVPDNVCTALEANAWTYNVDPEVIRALEKRT